ncbi:MAG: hypothetical protein KJ879_00700 [Nanoarchaeota archaeon]|nr:hypothetical protein [Nanoarchaeota archaeon]
MESPAGEFEVSEVGLENLKDLLKEAEKPSSGKAYYSAESVFFTTTSELVEAINVGKKLTPEDIEKLTGEKTRGNFRREGKKWNAPLEVICLSPEKRDVFERFKMDVKVNETISKSAKKQRQGVLANLSGLDRRMRDLFQSFNLAETKLTKELGAQQRRLSDVLKEYNGKVKEYLDALRDDPLVLAYAEHNPKELPHALDVLNRSTAIYLIGSKNLGTSFDKIDEGVRHLLTAAVVHDCADSFLKKSTLRGEQFKKVFGVRDFIIPPRMFTTNYGEDGEKDCIDGMTPESLEAIQHHHTRRDGRLVIFPAVNGGGEKNVAYVSRDSLRMSPSRGRDAEVQSILLEKAMTYQKSLVKGAVDEISEIKGDLFQPLYLAERWVSSKTRLEASLTADKLRAGRGLVAKGEYVDALMEIIDKNYE